MLHKISYVYLVQNILFVDKMEVPYSQNYTRQILGKLKGTCQWPKCINESIIIY